MGKDDERSDDVNDEESNDSWAQVPPKRTLFSLCLTFTLTFTAFEAIQNLQSSMNDDDNVGVMSLALIYGFVLITAPLSPFLLRVFGTKNVLLAVWVSMTLYCSANFYASLATLIPASILMGITLGNVGVIHGLYLAAASKSYVNLKHMNKDRLHSILSLFNGIFFMSFKSAQIIGNFFSSVILSSSNFNESLTMTNECGASVCSFSSANSSILIEPPDKEVIYILLGVYMACIIAGLLVTIFLIPSLGTYTEGESESDNDARESLNGDGKSKEKEGCRMPKLRNVFIFAEMLKTKFVFLIPLFVAQAMSLMILYTGFTQAFVSCSAGIQWVGYIMMAYGVSGSTFAFSVNFMARYINRAFLITSFIIVDVGIIITFSIWEPTHNTHVGWFFFISTLAGFVEGTSQPQFNALVSTVFKRQEPQAYACFNFARGIGFSLSLVLSSVVCLYYRLCVTLVLYCLGALGYMILEVLEWRKKKYGQDSGHEENHCDLQEKKKPLVEEKIIDGLRDLELSVPRQAGLK